MRIFEQRSPAGGRFPARWVCVFPLLIVNACASHQAYPRPWPPLVQNHQTCSALSGEYRNEGKTAEGSDTWLSIVLLNTYVPVDRMTLSVHEGEPVVVRAEFPDRDPMLVSGDDVSCRRGTLVVHPGGHWFVAGGATELPLFAVGKRSTTLELHAVENGLVIRLKKRVNGVAVVIPYTHSDATWHRFERVAPG